MGGQNGAILALIFAGGMNFFSYWFSDKMVLRRYNAEEVGPNHPSGLYEMVERLAMNAELPMPKVYIIPENTPNAFATGRNPENAAVAATKGILNLLDENELAGVMAHELAHVKHRDILTSSVTATLAGAITAVTQFGRFAGGSSRNRNPIGSLLILIGAPLVATVIRMGISRVREYEADRGGAEISGQPLALANALNKLQTGVAKYPLRNGNPAHSHMFIVNPFLGLGGMQRLFTTHPPTDERIRRLEELSRQIA